MDKKEIEKWEKLIKKHNGETSNDLVVYADTDPLFKGDFKNLDERLEQAIRYFEKQNKVITKPTKIVTWIENSELSKKLLEQSVPVK